MNRKQTVEWLLENGVLKFGDFTLKSGRKSKYFFNLGEMYKARNLNIMGRCFVDRLSSVENKDRDVRYPDVVFGPAYKGIPLAISLVSYMGMYVSGVYGDLGYCFNRKEDKDHGDGGKLVGANLKDKKVLIIDDVITSGGSLTEARDIIEKKGGIAVGCLVFVDRMEKQIEGGMSTHRIASEMLTDKDGLNMPPIISVLSIKEIVEANYKPEEYGKYYTEILKTIKEV